MYTKLTIRKIKMIHNIEICYFFYLIYYTIIISCGYTIEKIVCEIF